MVTVDMVVIVAMEATVVSVTEAGVATGEDTAVMEATVDMEDTVTE